MNKWSTVVLFGDSLTQQCFDRAGGGWGSLLADRLQRISDVVCRGFSGYNTRWCKTILPELFEDQNMGHVSCATILLGSNDSCHADSPTNQQVPLDEYSDNLKDIVSHFESIGVSKNKLLLLSPPPYRHDMFVSRCKEMGLSPPHRSNNATCHYADACLEVSKNTGVDVVDLFKAFSSDGRQEKLFSDGLHLSPEGAQLLFDVLWPFVEKRVLAYHQTLDMNYPHWSQVDFNNYKESLLK